MSCLTKNGAPVGITCALTGERKNVIRFAFIRKDFYATDVATASANKVTDQDTGDKAKNAVIATQIAAQAASATAPTLIMWTGVVDEFNPADPESEEFSVSKMSPKQKVYTNRVLTFVDKQAYAPNETLAGSIGAIAKQDDIFTNVLPATAKLAHHINHKAIRDGGESCIFCFVTDDGMLYPIRDKQGDPLPLTVTNFLKPSESGTNTYWGYQYEITGSGVVGDWFTENAIPFTDLSVLTVAGTNDQYLKLLYKL